MSTDANMSRMMPKDANNKTTLPNNIAKTGAPMGLQWVEMGEHNLGDFLVLIFCYCIFVGFMGVKLFQNG